LELLRNIDSDRDPLPTNVTVRRRRSVTAILARIVVHISDPRSDLKALGDLATLWAELHAHHREVAVYPALVRDIELSWERRLGWYHRLLADGGSYLTATDDEGRLIGYAMVAVQDGPDDTFDVKGGIAEVVTLVVARSQRSAGVGRALLAAAEQIARDRGFDTVKIAVMSGNTRAQEFYEKNGYSAGEQLLYRRFDTR
jgi:ribosomal protein S18 acetylase RimI-like enzyme